MSLTRMLVRRLLVLLLAFSPVVFAQNPETMDPEQSAAKAKEILKQLIDAMGGHRYLAATGRACEGRRANFGHNGDLTGYVPFKDFWSYPDKHRTDYGKKGNIVDLYAGDQGWTLDKEGVSEEPATAVTDFQEALRRDPGYLLRNRLQENGITIRYGGSSVADLRFVDWVEIVDSEDRTYRLAVDHSTHLLERTVVSVRDENTGEKSEEITLYTNYQLKDGIQVPLQITRERDGRRISQLFYEDCRFNPQLAPDFFTKAGLEKRFAEVGGKKSKR